MGGFFGLWAVLVVAEIAFYVYLKNNYSVDAVGQKAADQAAGMRNLCWFGAICFMFVPIIQLLLFLRLRMTVAKSIREQEANRQELDRRMAGAEGLLGDEGFTARQPRRAAEPESPFEDE